MMTTPPLGLMRISWKHVAGRLIVSSIRSPPLGLMRISWKLSAPVKLSTTGFCSGAPPLGLMRISWKLHLELYDFRVILTVAPPLGLMRISWKRLSEQLMHPSRSTPPLGLMRISWKLNNALPIFTSLKYLDIDPTAWVNAD